jgi:saccharopine dehydrogenase-like NADP-dependent oxidoreductase
MFSKTVLQLGYGMQGKASLQDILKNTAIGKIIVADISPEIDDLPRKLKDERIVPMRLDVNDTKDIRSLMEKADVIIELMPGIYTLHLAKLAVEAGTSFVSSMYLQNPGEQDLKTRELQKREILLLDEQARAKHITILHEFGMDPGMDLILGWKAVHELDDVRVFHSYGAGFPELAASHNSLRYKFTWSVIGVIKSYLRPARIIKDGESIDIPADAMFSKINTHMLKLPQFDSPLECFPNGDSVSFAAVFGVQNTIRAMGRYICRWPGTGAFWEIMAKSGFLSSKPIRVGDADVAPEAFCAALLGGQEQFYYAENERDVALIRSDARGYINGEPTRIVLQIVDYRDLRSGLTAMQRTVGFPMSIGAQMILDGTLAKTGVVSPVEVPFKRYMEEIEKRGIYFTKTAEVWDGNMEPA